MISANENFTCKIGNGRLAENIFLEKISHDLSSVMKNSIKKKLFKVVIVFLY